MVGIAGGYDTQGKLAALSADGQYDLAYACGTNADDRCRRAPEGDRWIYPVTLPNGGRSVLFKTLISNECANDCRYCPLRTEEIPFDETGRLLSAMDPKEHWVRSHPERFPVNVNRARREDLLRVPRFGPTTVARTLRYRTEIGQLRRIENLGRTNQRLRKAAGFVVFS